MDTLLGIAIGIGLSAASGFRVFVPLLVINLAAATGHLHLSPGCAWLGTQPATVAFATATMVEALAYYLPGLDHALDVLATPAAIVAGTVLTASMITGLSPFLHWTLSLIAGGAVAGLFQASTVALRAMSFGSTAGLGNPFVSSLEIGGAIVLALLAILVPLLCLALVVVLFMVLLYKTGRYLRHKVKIP